MNSPGTLAYLLTTVHRQVAAALWLSAGMICAITLIVFSAAGCRRSALVCGLLYSYTLCNVPTGHAEFLGPCGIAVALLGLLWPRRTAPVRFKK